MKKAIPHLLGRAINTLAIVSPRLAGRIGFRLFCFPMRGKIKGFHHQFLETASQSSMLIKGQEIKLYRWGNGPKTVLFLHGWQSHSFRWKNYVENFPDKDYSLYAIDAPGHGLSGGNFLTVPLYSDIIEKVIVHLGRVDAIVSHSLGSFTTLYTLYRLPLLPVGRIVLLAPPGDAEEFISFYKSTLRLSDRAIQHIKRHFEWFIQEPVSFFAATSFAAHINCAGLIIHDEDDDETSFMHSVNIHKAWKKSRLLLTKGLTHNLKSPEIVREVVEFILKGNDEQRVPQDALLDSMSNRESQP
jgi:pimeloyl-ACP methyl ester carboxylesterase